MDVFGVTLVFSLIQSLSIGPISGEVVVLVILALLISSIGFIKTVYFVSIGYAFSIAAMSVFIPLYFSGTIDLITGIFAGLLFFYGARLGIYLLLREYQSAYIEAVEGDYATRTSLGLKGVIWIGVSILYVAMFSPALFAFQLRYEIGAQPLSALTIIGLVAMFCGLLIETTSDLQKSALKKKNPGVFCATGLYRVVRCPNYLGEILFWSGCWIAGIHAYQTWIHWIFSLIGYLCIVLIMLGSTKRLEASQGNRYGSTQEYRDYVSSTPILFPFLPIYTLQNWKIVLE